MKRFTDQMNREVKLTEFPPKKIISLVPSITELLFQLELEKQVAGITKFCVHPKNAVKTKHIIGGTKNFHIDKIKQINPDLIIGNKEENVKNQIEELEKLFPVWMSDVNDFNEALQMILQIGEITGTNKKAHEIIENIQNNFSKIIMPERKMKTSYLIWQNPFMTIGADTFINSMLSKAGFENVFENEKRYPEITLQNIIDKQTEILILSSEPYPFKEKNKKELENYLPGIKIILADGEMFSWYGSRMMNAAQYFIEMKQQLKDK